MRERKLSLKFLLVHAIATLFMTGVIWIVQLVHYPLFAYVEPARFIEFEGIHTALISLVVVPAMLIELLTGVILLRWRPVQVSFRFLIIGLILLLLVWGSTFYVQVPLHGQLSRGFSAKAHGLLVSTNWVRTVLWSLRSVLVSFMLYQCLSLPRG